MLKAVNPSCKCVGVLIPGLLVSFRYQIPLNICLFGACLLLLVASRVSIPKIVRALLPTCIAAAGLFMSGYLFSADTSQIIVSSFGKSIVYPSSVFSGLQLSTRILAYTGLGMVFSFTTNMRDFICSLEQQMKIPSRFAYGVLAAFHLGPMMPHEYKKTSHAFLARGQRFFPLSAKVLVPFIVKSVRWSESLSVAMESKGFDPEGMRSCLNVMRVKWFDWAFILLSTGLTCLGIFLLK